MAEYITLRGLIAQTLEDLAAARGLFARTAAYSPARSRARAHYLALRWRLIRWQRLAGILVHADGGR